MSHRFIAPTSHRNGHVADSPATHAASVDTTGGPKTSAINRTRQELLDFAGLNDEIVGAQGTQLFTQRGDTLIDFVAQFGAVPFGYRPKQIVDAAMRFLGSERPTYVQPLMNPDAEALARRLIALAPGQMRQVSFATGGADAVETAIKLARAATHHELIVGTSTGFHGKTLGAVGVTGKRIYREPFLVRGEGFAHVRYGDLDALEAILRDQRVAAFFVEAVQGEAGMITPPPQYLAQAQALCRRYGALFVLDEIQTGLGRTGRLFAAQAEGLEPDVLLLAKALGGGLVPIGACIYNERAWSREFDRHHSSTFGINGFTASIGLAVLDHLTADHGAVIARVAEAGSYLRTGLDALVRQYPDVFESVDGRGLMLGLKFRHWSGERLYTLSLASAFGALVPIVCGYLRARHRVYCLPTLSESNVLRIQPSFVVTNREIDVLLDGLHAAAELIARQEQHRMILYAHSAHREEPAPPKHAPEGRCLGRFAFLMHPTTQESVNGDAVVAPFDLTEDERAFMRDWLAEFSEWSKPDLDAGVSYRTGKIFNREGDYVEGWLIASLLQPRDLMRLNPSRRRKLLGHYLDAVRKLEIDVLGLGAYTSVISGAGTEMTSERWATTTGNSLTAMIGVESLLSACAGSGRPLAQRIAGVIGAYGSVGRLASLRLARFAERLVLIGNAANTAAMDALRRVGGELYLQALRACRKGETGIGLARVVAPHLPDAATVDSWIDSAHDEPGLRDLFERMDALMRSIAADAAPVTITSDLAHWLPRLEVVLSATSNGTAFIDPTLLHANAILCDCAQPPDIAAAALPQRPDVTVIEGGLIRMPDPTCRFGQQNLTNLPTGVAFSCLAETIVLTMAGKRRDYSIGKSPPLEDAEEIFALAQGFGFAPLPPSRMSAAAASAPDGLSPLAPLPAPIAIASKIATPMVAPTATLASPAPTSLTRTAHMPLQSAFDTAEKRLPGLVGALRARGLMTLEQGEPAALCALARTHRAAGLIIPEALGGTGASPTETVDILRAVGALCPSLAVMLTMHYHTIATMVQLGAIPTAEELLQGVAHHQWLVASAFAEGKPGSAVFNASVKVSPVEGGYALNGTKKPCSMSHDMDVIAVGVARVEGDGSTTEGFAMVINEGSPIAREAFWNTRILRASDSNALVFKDVFVPHERMLMPDAADDIEAAMLAQRAALAGLCWFQLMVGATYLGVASALVERLLAKRKSEDFALAQLAIELEGAHQALIGSARELEALEGADEAAYSRALCVRFLVQGAIERATNLAVELLGGMAFIGSDEVSYLLSASRAICFHPISRTAAAPMLAEFLRGPAEATAPAQTSHVAEANPADIDDSKRIAA